MFNYLITIAIVFILCRYFLLDLFHFISFLLLFVVSALCANCSSSKEKIHDKTKTVKSLFFYIQKVTSNIFNTSRALLS